MAKYVIVFTAQQEIEAKNEKEAREVFLSGETLPEGIDMVDFQIEVVVKE